MAKRKLEENDISTIEDDEFKSFSDRDEQIDELSNGHAKHRENNAQESDDHSASEDDDDEDDEEEGEKSVQPPNKKQKAAFCTRCPSSQRQLNYSNLIYLNFRLTN